MVLLFWTAAFLKKTYFVNLVPLSDLGGFEITVEHESASGLTTEVESKWSHVKAEHGEPK